MGKDKTLALGIFKDQGEVYSFYTEVKDGLSDSEIVTYLCKENNMPSSTLVDFFIVKGTFAFCNLNLRSIDVE